MFAPRISLFFATALIAASATIPEYSRRIWRTEDGLPQNRIQAISQTSDGFLWIGTSGGLVRFDGVRFVVFDRSNTPAFQDDSILTLRPGSAGALWIGTEGGGLVLLQNREFTSFGREDGLTNPFVRAIVEDRSGTLWVGTDRGLFARHGRRFERVDGHDGLPIFATRTIEQDATGSLWISANTGMYRVEDGHVRSAGAAFTPLGSFIFAIQNGADGLLWFAGNSGLWRLDRDRPNAPTLVDGSRVRALVSDRSGSLWAGAVGRGLVRISGGERRTWLAPGDLPDNTVLSIFEDREGNLWAGTEDGLMRFTRSAVTMLTTRDGLADDSVATVYQDREGTVWIATTAGIIYRRENGRLIPFHPGLAAHNVYEDRSGAFWFGSLDEGARRVAAGGNLAFNMTNGLRSNFIRQFLETSDGMLWMATGSGLTRWDGRSIRTFYLEDGLAYGGVRSLAEDRNGDLLVGTDGGLNRVRAGKFIADAVFTRLGNQHVWSILSTPSGAIWLGTRGGGLYRIRDRVIKHLTTRDGLLSNSIYQIIDDGRGRLWFSTPAGIFSAARLELEAIADGRPGPVAIVPYGAADGLESTQMHGGIQTAGCQTREGDLWFPSVKGAVRIDPRQMHLAPASPVLIESVRLDDRILAFGSGMVIPPRRGKLEIDYTSCALRSPDRLTFQYRLEGFDHEWTSTPHSRAAVYANLTPGTYRFRVQARDGAFPRSQSEATLAFTWQPHFWETLWFRVAAFAVAGLLAWAAFLLFIRQTRARYAMVLAERTRVAREMHDTLLQGCVGVSTLLEAAAATPVLHRDLLDHARSQIRVTIDEAREAIWDLRNPAWEREFATQIRSFAQHASRDSGVSVTTEIKGAVPPLKPHLARTLLLVAREAIRNSVAHGKPSLVAVGVTFEPQAVLLEVADNGLGFEPKAAVQNGHFGIIGMRERVEQLGGEFDLASAPGAGAIVRVVVPLRQSANEDSSPN